MFSWFDSAQHFWNDSLDELLIEWWLIERLAWGLITYNPFVAADKSRENSSSFEKEWSVFLFDSTRNWAALRVGGSDEGSTDCGLVAATGLEGERTCGEDGCDCGGKSAGVEGALGFLFRRGGATGLGGVASFSGSSSDICNWSVWMEALALATISGSDITMEGLTGTSDTAIVFDTSGVVQRLMFSLLVDLEVNLISPPNTRPMRPRETVLCKLTVSWSINLKQFNSFTQFLCHFPSLRDHSLLLKLFKILERHEKFLRFYWDFIQFF